MKRITLTSKLLAIALPVVATLALAAAPIMTDAAFAAPENAKKTKNSNLRMGKGAEAAKGQDQQKSLFEDVDGETSLFKIITNALLFLIGAISVIMLVYGGILYTTSGGNQEMITKAKHTIMYAVIGIIVALLAFAIVNFFVGELSNDSTD